MLRYFTALCVAVSVAVLALLYGMHTYATTGVAAAHATRAAVLARY